MGVVVLGRSEREDVLTKSDVDVEDELNRFNGDGSTETTDDGRGVAVRVTDASILWGVCVVLCCFVLFCFVLF